MGDGGAEGPICRRGADGPIDDIPRSSSSSSLMSIWSWLLGGMVGPMEGCGLDDLGALVDGGRLGPCCAAFGAGPALGP